MSLAAGALVSTVPLGSLKNLGMDANEFRRLGHLLVDWIADYREGLERFPVMSAAKPGEIRAKMPKAPPTEGQGLEALLPELSRVVLPGITHWNHPRFFAYFPSNTTFASILGDLVSSGLGVQGMSWQTSPAATEVEEVVMDWLRQMLGLSEAFTGVIHDTASTATLCALLCARERASGFSQAGKGLQSGAAPLVVYGSDQSHSSVEKAALLAGFGRSYLRLLPTDENHALRVDALEAALAEDRRAGLHPAAVVATLGTTGTTAVDPLEAIGRLAQREGLWLHVDAAMAGSALILPELRWMAAGIEAADSMVLNPHKWMGVGFDFSAYYVRDPQHLIRVMSTNPSYLRTSADGEVKNFRDWHIPLGRRFRALKLWFVLADQGVRGLQERFRRDLALAQGFAAQVDATPHWERLAPVPLQTVCVRHCPKGVVEEARLSTHNLALAHRINQGGKAYITPALLKGKQMLRVSIGAEGTEAQDVAVLWEEMKKAAEEVEANPKGG